MEKDYENEVYAANGEIRVLIAIRILSCFCDFWIIAWCNTRASVDNFSVIDVAYKF